MTIGELETALQELRDADGIVDVRECKDATFVDEVEGSLGIQFSKELRDFYERYEYLQVEAEEFTWIRTLGDTLAAIRSSSRKIPETYIPILDDGRGGHYYVACQKRGQEKPDEFGNVYYNPGDEPNTLEYTASDFYAFAISRAKFWAKNI